MRRRKKRLKMLKVLVGCESSGTVRRAFRALGADAYSCDTLPADDGSEFHFQDDVRNHLTGYDLLILHPPCTHLAISGAAWFKYKAAEQKAALDFVRELMAAPSEYIAIENPVSIISSQIRKPDQIIQPFQFGHAESKKTCLWLKNLPKLTYTDVLLLPERGYWNNQTASGQNNVGQTRDRWKKRSKTYDGIARAMAEQWTNYILDGAFNQLSFLTEAS